MKKVIAIAALCFVCSGAALFGQTVSLSVGGGGFFTADFTSVTLNPEAKDAIKAYNDKVPSGQPKMPDNYNKTLIGAGFYGFFDATYVEANLGVLFGNEKQDQYPADTHEDTKKGIDVTALKIGLFGKYPFQLGGKAAVFPMLGVDIMVPLGGRAYGHDLDSDILKKDGKDFKSWYFDNRFTQVWLKLGVGADFYATDHIFIRPEFMYGIRVNRTDDENDIIGKWDNDKKPASGVLGHGLDIRMAVGYRF
jgi:hypothetical protein